MLNIYEAAESSLQTALTVGTPDAFTMVRLPNSISTPPGAEWDAAWNPQKILIVISPLHSVVFAVADTVMRKFPSDTHRATD